jgi:hypothetical protein
MLEYGISELVDAGIMALKKPTFDHRETFDFSVFGVTFTHVMARSMWTHASKPQIERMLDGFAAYGEQGPCSWRASFLRHDSPSSRSRASGR